MRSGICLLAAVLGVSATAVANPIGIGYVAASGGTLYKIDLSNAAVLDTQTMGRTALSLALDSNGTLWGAFFIGSSTFQLGTIDPTNGAITYSPSTFTGILDGVYGLAFDDTDNLFLMDGTAIYSMNQSTGAISGTYASCDIGGGAVGLGFGRDGQAWMAASTQLQEAPQNGCGTFGGSVPGGSGLDQIQQIANSGAVFYGVTWAGGSAASAELVSFDGTTFSSTPSLTVLGSLPSTSAAIAVPFVAPASVPEPGSLGLLAVGGALLVGAKRAARKTE